MEEGTPEKRTRPRTKSSVVEKAAGETAPNLNGSKDGGQDAVVENMDTTSTPITKPEEGIESEEKPSQGRKRKAEDSKEDEIEQKQVEEKPKTKGIFIKRYKLYMNSTFIRSIQSNCSHSYILLCIIL